MYKKSFSEPSKVQKRTKKNLTIRQITSFLGIEPTAKYYKKLVVMRFWEDEKFGNNHLLRKCVCNKNWMIWCNNNYLMVIV